MLMLLVISIPSAWAADETVIFSDQNYSNQAVVSSYVGTDFVIGFDKGSNSNAPKYYTSGTAIRAYGGNKMTVQSNTKTITEIVLTFGSGDGSNAITTDVGTYSNGTWTGSASTVVFTIGGTSGNRRLAGVAVTYATGGEKTLSSVAVSGTPTKTAYYAGDEFDPAGLVVTGTYSDDSQAPIASGITWAYDPSQTLALNQTSIGVTATVNEISSPKFNVTGLTVTAPVVSNWQVTAPADLNTGDVVVLTMLKNNVYYAAPNNGGSSAPVATPVTVANNILSNVPGETLQWTVTVVEEGVYQFSVGNNYLKCTDTNNGVKVGTGDYNTFDINTTNDKQYLHTTETMSGAANGRYLGIYNTQDWRCYSSVHNNIKDGSLVIFREPVSSKEAAGLAFETAAYLVKANGSLTTPTLTNPNSLSVSYASSDANVVAVNENTGALTIKSSGKAVITVSSAETDTYKAGSASYTIYVAEQAGTAEDPLTEASAKTLIDNGCTLNAHVTGTVQSKTFYSSSGSYNVTLTNGFIFYYFYAASESTPFESDILTNGDVLVGYGQLMKYSSSYEINPSYMVSREPFTEPLVDISNTKETAYTVAEALELAANPTSDLSKAVYIAGVVYKANSFNQENGTYNIYVRDPNKTEEEGKFEFYKCSGLYQIGETAVPFTEGDVREGDEVIGYGVMTYYSQSSIWQFGQPNQLVALNRPEVAVTSVTLNKNTATVGVGATITLTATVAPENASNKTISWSIVSGDAYASVNDGVVTGLAEGTTVVRAASSADNTKYAECTITIAAADPTYLYYNYEKVTATADIEDGEYLIVYEGESVAFNGGLETLDAANNSIAVEINDGIIVSNTTTDAAAFTIDVTAGTLRAAMGDYIGVTSYGNGLKQNANSATYTAHSFSIDGDGNAIISLNNNWEASMILNYNTGASDKRFRYYKNGSQKKIQLYKKVGTNETPKSEAGLAWNPADDIELTVGDAFTAPTLSNPNNIAADEIEITSSNTSLATITAGVVSLVENATGVATITATFAGNDNYKAATVSYNITVNSSAPTPTSTIYRKVTATAEITDGEYLIVYEGDATHDAAVFDGSLDNVDQAMKVLAVEIENDEIAGNTDLDAATFTIDVTAGSLQSASGWYIGRTANSNGMDKSTTEAYVNTFAITEGVAVITGVGGCTLRYNYASDQLRFRYYKSGQQAIQLYKKESVEPVEPELSYENARTGLTIGKFYTICMPQNILGVRGATFWNLNNRNEDGSMVYFVEAKAPFDKGKPYIFIATAETLEVAYGEENAGSPVANGALHGTFSAMTQSDFDAISAANSSSPIYMLVDNQLRQVAGRSGNSLGANRAYVIYNELQAGEPTPAPGRRVLAMPMNENVATDIDALGSDAQPSKIIVNGQLFIIRDGKAYDATGRQVSKF